MIFFSAFCKQIDVSQVTLVNSPHRSGKVCIAGTSQVGKQPGGCTTCPYSARADIQIRAKIRWPILWGHVSFGRLFCKNCQTRDARGLQGWDCTHGGVQPSIQYVTRCIMFVPGLPVTPSSQTVHTRPTYLQYFPKA